MRRGLLNFIVDAVTAAVMLGMVATGLLIRFVLPPGSGSRRSLWGLGRHDWGDVHFWLAVAIGVLAVVHVALHWQWVCNMALRLCRRSADEHVPARPLARNLMGLGFVAGLVAFFAAFVWFASCNVRETDGGGQRSSEVGHGREHDSESVQGELIRGSMTLSEAAAVGGIPVETLRQRLGLPAGTAPDERLGRLSHQHGFSMTRVREVFTTNAPKPAATEK